MRNYFSIYPFFGLLSIICLSACSTPEVAIVSCTSQVYYPGQQEVKPYQEIVVKTEALEEAIQIDSLKYGEQTIDLKQNQSLYFGQAQGTSFSSKAILYYSRNNKVFSVEIDTVKMLDPLYLP
ncbi:MAG: hypothetical protein ACFHU9_11735 [Fluviicola sp.]